MNIKINKKLVALLLSGTMSFTLASCSKQKDNYENLQILLDNDNYLNEMLSENHFRFLPLYGSYKQFGYTNKDLMVSFINSIPEIADKIKGKVNRSCCLANTSLLVSNRNHLCHI